MTGKKSDGKQDGVKQYIHEEQKRVNNPPVGLVTAETDHLNGKKTYQFDPHLDPQLQWAGKVEGVSLDVDTVSLHVHERIDPLTIIDAVRKKELQEQQTLFHYFETKENNPPIREAIEFYKHSQGWSNRLIAGDSLLVMNSLLEKEGMAGKVQMIYIDPPYGIRYGSNFQPFVNKRDVKDGKDEDLTQEPEMIKAFRDTWELGIHSYLTYLRNRLLLARELLTESGSCFVQISDENVHHVKEIMDEVFGVGNFCGLIPFKKTSGQASALIAGVCDYLLWYGKSKAQIKYHQLYGVLGEDVSDSSYNCIEFPNGEWRRLNSVELYDDMPLPVGKRFRTANLTSQGATEEGSAPFEFEGRTYAPSAGTHWKPNRKGLENLAKRGRLVAVGNTLAFKRYIDDFPVVAINNLWSDTIESTFVVQKAYVVQTATKVIVRCLLMTTDPGDLVLDPTCGSGTTAYVAEQWGRRWITCDTSRVSITLGKQRLMTALFDYYELAHPKEGVSSGFNYKKVPHITLGSIANNEPPAQETLYDQPIIDRTKKRVTGPFTLEAVPSQRVRSFEDVKTKQEADITIARSGETLKQNEWIDEMLSTGIRGKGGQILQFVRIEPLGGTRWVHAEAETKDGQKAVISFGPEYAPLEQRQVELAIEDSQTLVPKPKIVIFASFQFDPEAAKDIDELKWGGVTVLKVQMNTDLLTSDLKKKRASNESFWLVGQPDIELKKQGSKYAVVVNGFDYYNTKTGEIESGDISKIAMWELDTDYDGRSLYPRQVFFPMAGANEGWSRLAKNLKAQIDEELIEKYKGNTSLPFNLGNNKQIAVKIIDDRGIESLKIIKVRE
jgi:adenine-specific DNA-methyltransferase